MSNSINGMTGIEQLSDITESDLKNKINGLRKKKSPTNEKFIGLAVGAISAVLVGVIVISAMKPSKVEISKSVNVEASKVEERKSILETVKEKVSSVNVSNNEYIPNETELTKKHNAYEDIKSTGNFKLSGNKLSDSQIAKEISLVSLEKQNYFLALASMAEGYRKNPYADNKGIATGFGYNASMQTRYTNTQIFSMITKDQSVINSGVSLTGVMSMEQARPEDIKNIVLAPQQAAQITQMMRYEFASPMPKIIGEHAKLTSTDARKEMSEKSLSPTEYGKLLMDSLKQNEKEAIVYHGYKVGTGGFSKYKGLLTSLVNYRYNNTIENADKVASHFTYKYTMNGVVKEDTRATGLVSSMFLDSKAFGYFVGKTKTYPDSLKSRIAKFNPKVFKTNNDNLSEMNLNDEVGEYIEELEKKGITIDHIKIEQKLSPKDLEPYSAIKQVQKRNASMGSFFGGTF